MKNGRRKTVRKISFLTAIIALLLVYGTVSTVKFVKAERLLNASRERALTELGTHLDTISLNLDKCLYAGTSPMIANVSTEVWRASTDAKTNLSEITDGVIINSLSLGKYQTTASDRFAIYYEIGLSENAPPEVSGLESSLGSIRISAQRIS